MFLQLLINAFSLGSFYALVALGFSLIFGVTHAFNLAHGELIVLSGYLAYGLINYLHLPFLTTFPICMFLFLLAAILLFQVLRFVRGPFELNSLVVTFGLALVFQNIMLTAFSADYRFIRSRSIPIELIPSGIVLTQTQLMLIVFSLLATALVHALLRRTFLGKALRATIQDREAARLAGINVDHMTLIAFGIGGALIGLAGPLYAQTAYLHPFGGSEATRLAIIISIFAGVGRIRPLLYGGWVLGLVESLTIYVLGTGWREFVSALLLIALLLLMPEGIFSRPAKSPR
jgi:branched-chain amino acid transport system permease protein